MRISTDRILTTHVGSLPRPDDLIELLQAKDAGNLTDEAARALEARSALAVREIVQKQRDIGIDIPSDGEQSKPDYSTYIKDRFTGFAGPPSEAMDVSRDRSEFPDYTAGNRQGGGAATVGRPTCNGPIAWRDFAAVQRDVDNLKAAAGDGEVFMTSVSPGQAARFLRNEGTYYKNDGDVLERPLRARSRTSTRRSPTPDCSCRSTAPDPAPADNGSATRRCLSSRSARHAPGVVRGRSDEERRPGADAATPLLGQLQRPAHPRRPAGGDHRAVLKSRSQHLVRGRQPAPRARVDACSGREAAGGQGAHPRRHRHLRPTSSSTRRWSPNASSAMQRWSVARTLSPARTAASPRLRASLRCIRS